MKNDSFQSNLQIIEYSSHFFVSAFISRKSGLPLLVLFLSTFSWLFICLHHSISVHFCFGLLLPWFPYTLTSHISLIVS